KDLDMGGFLKAGEVAFKIDDQDYQLVRRQTASQVSKARFELQVEAGRQKVAKKEWALLEAEIDTSDGGKKLALRQPHLRLAQANVSAARSVMERARLNVAKTVVTVPFNAYVSSEMVEMGLLAQPGAQLAQIVGTDTFWIDATVPLERLSSIRIPGEGGVPAGDGATVKVTLAEGGDGGVFHGRVLRLLNELDPLGVQARLLVEVHDPLRLAEGNAGMRLFRGAFVDLEIDATTLENVVEIPRKALREDSKVWVKVGKTLEMRDVVIIWRERDRVLIRSGVEPGELLIINRISKVTDRMPVRHHDEAPPKEAAAEAPDTGAAKVAADGSKGTTGAAKGTE
ncbi:MAG: RND family efflux transporter MFP subunit, partial [Myxococcota bacterium]